MDYEDYVRNDSEIKEKIVCLKKDLKVFIRFAAGKCRKFFSQNSVVVDIEDVGTTHRQDSQPAERRQ